uniref:ABC transmembrane type-1 domain-containing protein n=1 Tax=Strigamia maritima TaxID=126957 RepID=T1J5T0_STRMM
MIQTSGQRIVKRLRNDTFRAVLSQEMYFFDSNKTGELINRLTSDAYIVGNSLTQNLSDGLRSLTSSIASVTMMVYTSANLAFVGLCTVTPVALLAVFYGRFLRTITRKVQNELAAANQITEERISNIRTVRAFAQEHTECSRYDSKLWDVLELQYKEALAKAIFFGMVCIKLGCQAFKTGLSGNLIVLSVLYYGGTMMTDAQITVGDLSAFIMYAGYLGLSLGGLTSFYTELMKGLGASSKLWAILDKKPSIPVSGGFIPQSPGPGLIEFKNVYFSYPSRPEVKIFNGLNLTVPAGSITAIVGGSGSGKSTVSSLLLRFYDPQQGNIYVDGLELNSLDPKWLRTQIGLVSQEPVLFSSSIRDNILYGAKLTSTDQEIISACKEANAFDFIQNFPDKFNTLVGQQGLMLSGGQRQRIAIARAILKNPTILILDEATSALDAESEFLVQEAIDKLMRGRTVITIAHRLSTIARADRIAVFKNGVIVEMGPYDKLMSIPDGVFQKLIEKQTIT